MSMKLNGLEDVKTKFRADFANAFAGESMDGMVSSIESYASDLCESLLAEYNEMSVEQRNDVNVLAQRGVRVLTSEENAWYSKVIGAFKSGSANEVRSALTNIDVTMPQTIIDKVMEDVQESFELLNAVDFVNTTYLTEWIYNAQGKQKAAFGSIPRAITNALSGSFKKVSAKACKATAYMVISKDYLDLGPAWLDRYVRAILTEAMGVAMEEQIVMGAGAVYANEDGSTDVPTITVSGTTVTVKDKDGSAAATLTGAAPVGMARNVATGYTSGDYTVYPLKSATSVTEVTPEKWGALVANLARTATGRVRKVENLILVVNTNDYLTKVMPATTIQQPDGTYRHDVFPIATKVICSEGVPSGKAILGLGNGYLAMLGASKNRPNGKNGVIEYSDEYQFLEDNRVYAMHLYGNGMPKDNTSFLYLNISGLKPMYYPVKQITDET